jgi:valyl-tRNA synthetase
MAKLRIKDQTSKSPVPVLIHVLEKTLRLMHPFIPFVTEEIWQSLIKRVENDIDIQDSIMISAYPIENVNYIDAQAVGEIDLATGVVRAIRNVRAELKIESNQYMRVIVQASGFLGSLSEESDMIKALSKTSILEFVPENENTLFNDNAISAILNGATVVVPFEGLVDKKKEQSRLKNELNECVRNLDNLSSRLSNEDFLNKAPEHVIDKERERMDVLEERKKRIEDFLEFLN